MEKLNNLLIFLYVVPVILWWSLVYIEKFEALKFSSVSFFENEHSLIWLSEVVRCQVPPVYKHV